MPTQKPPFNATAVMARVVTSIRFKDLPPGWTTRQVKAGKSFVVPAGIVHDAHNNGTTAIKLLGVYVVEKGKPLATPAP